MLTKRSFLAATTAAFLSFGFTAKAQEKEIVIGIPIAVTGPFAFSAVPSKQGIETALKQLQESNGFGGAKVKLLFEDTGGDKNQATTLISKFIEVDKANLILGPTSSVEALAALPVAQSKGTPVLSTASADVTTVGDWIFKATATPVTIMRALADYAQANLQPKKVAYIFNRDNEAYIAQKNGVKNIIEPAGAETVAEETFVGTDTDFTALATKIASLDVDTVVVSSTAEVSANIIIQLKQAGLSDKVRILGTPSMASAKYLEVGGSAVEGTIFVTDYFFGSDSELNKKFVADYKAHTGKDPDIFAAIGYTQLQEAATAIRNANGDYSAESLRKAISSIKDLPVLLGGGKLTITEKRTPEYGGFVLTVKDGAFSLL